MALTTGWIYCFVVGEILAGALLLAADMAHALTVTILLLTGCYRDGAQNMFAIPGNSLTNIN
jgi:hypothetical protein